MSAIRLIEEDEELSFAKVGSLQHDVFAAMPPFVRSGQAREAARAVRCREPEEPDPRFDRVTQGARPMIAEPQSTEAPETVNREQDDEGAQAQTVAASALRERPLPDSEKANSGDEPDDVQDIVDHMHQMERSGRIDMDAFRGECSDDDEPGQLGPGGDED